jgi:iron complex outermembrane receptor protein
MIRSPTWSGNLTAHYVKETDSGVFEASGNFSYASKIYYDFTNRVTQPAYVMINANLSWQPPSSRFKLGLWARNLANEDVIQSVGVVPSGDHASYLAPRTYGVSVSYDY